MMPVVFPRNPFKNVSGRFSALIVSQDEEASLPPALDKIRELTSFHSLLCPKNAERSKILQSFPRKPSESRKEKFHKQQPFLQLEILEIARRQMGTTRVEDLGYRFLVICQSFLRENDSLFQPSRKTSIRIYIMERTGTCWRARTHIHIHAHTPTELWMDDKPLILPIEAWCWDWTRSFPYPFDVITAGTDIILATGTAIISRDGGKISRRIFTFSPWLLPVQRGILLISFDRSSLPVIYPPATANGRNSDRSSKRGGSKWSYTKSRSFNSREPSLKQTWAFRGRLWFLGSENWTVH